MYELPVSFSFYFTKSLQVPLFFQYLFSSYCSIIILIYWYSCYNIFLSFCNSNLFHFFNQANQERKLMKLIWMNWLRRWLKWRELLVMAGAPALYRGLISFRSSTKNFTSQPLLSLLRNGNQPKKEDKQRQLV